jgi:hypothetical protein
MTAAEQREVAKLAQLVRAVGLDASRLAEYPRRDRVGQLQRMQRQTVVGAVLNRYTYVDELLSCAVAWEFFDRSRSFSQLWRTKQFKAFNYFVLDQLYLAQKLKLVQYLHPVPKHIVSITMALNDLRNAVAHSFFPENRKQRPTWNGRLIFEVDAVAAFDSDTQEVVDWLWQSGLVDASARGTRGRRTSGCS